MKKKEHLEKIPYSTIFIILFAIPVIAMCLLFPGIKDADKASYWTDLFKILFSAVVSAAVAYVVSLIQLSKANAEKDREELKTNKKRIKLLILEIEDNKEVINLIKEIGRDENRQLILSSQLSSKILDMYFDKFILEEENLKSLMIYNKKLNLLSSLKSEEFKKNCEKLIEEIDTILSVLKKVN